MHVYIHNVDAVTVVLFNLLGAFSNRDIDPTLVNASERAIGVDDVRK